MHHMACPFTKGALGALLVALVATPSYAQSTGRLTGTVVDGTGAVLPGATVVVRNVATSRSFETVTAAEGLFRFPELPIGPYEITASLTGFQTLVRSDIELLTGQTLDVRLSMQLGDVNESIEVTGGIPLVQTTTSAVQTTIDSRAMSELPLNGRNPLQLVVLTPGADLTSLGTSLGQQDNTGVTVNGLRATDNNYQLDGAGFNNPMYGSAPTLPNPDTLGEFTVQSSSFNARESRAGSVVKLSTRSGTNRFSGSVFNFLRNDKMDARNFFAEEVSEFKRNQGGASLGGPIIRNRAFFFSSYQATIKRGSPSPKLLTVPSLEQREGLFPADRTIYDPLTGEPFPGNVIPEERFDSSAVALLPYIPLPNAGTNIAELPTDDDQDDHQGLAKVDYAYGDGNTLTVRYYYDRNQLQRDTNSAPGVFSVNDYRNQSVTVRDTHALTSRLTATNVLSYVRTFRRQVPEAPIFNTDVVDIVPANELTTPELRVNLGNYFNLFSGGPLQFLPSYWEWRGQVDWSLGAHLIGFGADVYRSKQEAIDNSFGSGIFTFSTLRTADSAGIGGDTFASFLLGLPARFQQTASDAAELHENRYHVWVQDDWRIHPRLTLNLGLRWEPTLPATDALGRLAGFAPGMQSTIAPLAPEGVVFSGDVADSIVPTDWNNFAPRVGAAWDVTGSGKTVMRGGFGIYYLAVPLATSRIVATNGPFRTLAVDFSDPASFSDPFGDFPGGTPFPFVTPSPEELLTWEFANPLSTISGVLDPNMRTGHTRSWNVTVEQQVLSDMAVSVAYVGQRTSGILSGLEANPAPYRPGATAADINSRRIHPGLAEVTLNTGWQWTNYHSLQVSVTKRARRGLSLLANYVFGKAIDIGTGGALGGRTWRPRDPFNWDIDKGPADTDVRHRLNLMVLFEVPGLAATAPRLARALVNDWQVNGILTAQSGYPVDINSGNRSLTGGNNATADLMGDPTRPEGVDPVEQFFNTDAFALPPFGSHGNLGRNRMRGPGKVLLDMSLFKNFRISDRFTIQYRLEAFNALNHANFDNPTAGVGGVNFGRILGAGDPRVLQMGLKLLF